MQEQLDKLGLEFEFFTAVDGRMLVGDELKNYSKKQSLKMTGRELSLGEIGCYLSHVKIWEEMIEEEMQKSFGFGR